MCAAAVDEHHRRMVSSAPDTEVYAATVDIDVAVLWLLVERGAEPRRGDRYLTRTGEQFIVLRI
jgi:hypothetical protein